LFAPQSEITGRNDVSAENLRVFEDTEEKGMAQGHIEDILVLTEEEENTPLFVSPRSRSTVRVRSYLFRKKRHI